MTTYEAGVRLNLSRSTIIGYCRLGIIAAVKPGRDWWIEREEIARYQRERRPRGRPPKPVQASGSDSAAPSK